MAVASLATMSSIAVAEGRRWQGFVHWARQLSSVAGDGAGRTRACYPRRPSGASHDAARSCGGGAAQGACRTRGRAGAPQRPLCDLWGGAAGAVGKAAHAASTWKLPGPSRAFLTLGLGCHLGRCGQGDRRKAEEAIDVGEGQEVECGWGV